MKNMPKLECPFERKEVIGRYVCIPKIKEKFKWIFTEDCLAVDKLDGTNVSIVINKGEIKEIYNRLNPIKMFTKGSKRFIEGIYETIERNYINLKDLEDGQYFGELIGPKVQGNPYKLNTHLWISFDYLKEKYYYKFWDSVVEELKDKTETDIFEYVSMVFKNLWSIYKRARKIKGIVDENSVFEDSTTAEGIVFYKKSDFKNFVEFNDTSVCKLRRDMFSWYKGIEHRNKKNGNK